ncbi:OmpA family protein [Maribacter sp. 2210JD10-5]|uniref:OmpA family protein n=1 Tax=Maribacter sp. 2210JD10-5 TaxID=3386272 RepID=UPI0039BC9A17
MKTTYSLVKIIFVTGIFMLCSTCANAQFLKKLGKRAEKAAERAVEKRVDKEATKKTDQVLDSILEPGSGSSKKTPLPTGGNPQNQTPDDNPSSENTNGQDASTKENPKTLSIYSKFDFVPGNEPLFFDDFSNEFVGDFPSKWNTNGGGELTTINDGDNKWLKILPGYNSMYIPDITDLPEDFTLEFDVIANGLNDKTSSQSFLSIIIADNNDFNKPKNFGMAEYSFCQFIATGVTVENVVNGTRQIRNTTQADIRDVVKAKHHVSVAVNQQRFRMWINEQKLVDVPRLLPANVAMKGIKFQLRGTNINQENIYLSNFKIAKGGVDLRRKLISEGKISTNGILFDSGSDNLKAESMGIIRQIYQVLQQEKGINLKIVGHTDADGASDANLKLSKARAEAVKNVLVDIYAVDGNRLSTQGKGETEAVGDNSTPEGKAQNRRVEFIKQ